MTSLRAPPYRPYSGRTLALWLLYAFVGAAIAVMMIAGGGDMTGDESRSPTRTRTKILGALSGLMLAVAALGWYLTTDPQALQTWPPLMLWIGAPLGALLAVWSWFVIAGDLNRSRRR
jgi:hypothetical protein